MGLRRALDRLGDAPRRTRRRELGHRCFTDGRALERFVPGDRDVAEDLNHLSVAGHAKDARIAWSALPDEVKQRP